MVVALRRSAHSHSSPRSLEHRQGFTMHPSHMGLRHALGNPPTCCAERTTRSPAPLSRSEGYFYNADAVRESRVGLVVQAR